MASLKLSFAFVLPLKNGQEPPAVLACRSADCVAYCGSFKVECQVFDYISMPSAWVFALDKGTCLASWVTCVCM